MVELEHRLRCTMMGGPIKFASASGRLLDYSLLGRRTVADVLSDPQYDGAKQYHTLTAVLDGPRRRWHVSTPRQDGFDVEEKRKKFDAIEQAVD